MQKHSTHKSAAEMTAENKEINELVEGRGTCSLINVRSSRTGQVTECCVTLLEKLEGGATLSCGGPVEITAGRGLRDERGCFNAQFVYNTTCGDKGGSMPAQAVEYYGGSPISGSDEEKDYLELMQTMNGGPVMAKAIAKYLNGGNEIVKIPLQGPGGFEDIGRSNREEAFEKGLGGLTPLAHITYAKKAKRDGISCGSSDEPNPCPISDDLYSSLKGEFGEE